MPDFLLKVDVKDSHSLKVAYKMGLDFTKHYSAVLSLNDSNLPNVSARYKG